VLVRDSIAIPIPTFRRWTDQPRGTGKRVDMYQLRESDGFALDVDDYVRSVATAARASPLGASRTTPTAGTCPGTASSACSMSSATSTWWSSTSLSSESPEVRLPAVVPGGDRTAARWQRRPAARQAHPPEGACQRRHHNVLASGRRR
jgi:hypothetical protein